METSQDNRISSLEVVNKAYSSSPWWYDLRGFFILTFTYRSSLLQQIDFFGKNISQNHLEAALGTGTLLNIILILKKILNQPFGQITGFDYAEKMLQGARFRFRKNPNVHLFLADIGNLPFDSNFFDSVNLANAFHSLPDPELGMKELFRVLKPNGKMAVNILLYPRAGWNGLANKINGWGQKKGLLKRPYSQEESLEIIKSSGFLITSETILGNTYNILAYKPPPEKKN